MVNMDTPMSNLNTKRQSSKTNKKELNIIWVPKEFIILVSYVFYGKRSRSKLVLVNNGCLWQITHTNFIANLKQHDEGK